MTSADAAVSPFQSEVSGLLNYSSHNLYGVVELVGTHQGCVEGQIDSLFSTTDFLS